MKILKGQKHSHYSNITLVCLDSLMEANSLIHEALADQGWLKEKTKECLALLRTNVYSTSEQWNAESLEKRLRSALEQIEKGNAQVEKEATDLAKKLVEQAYLIEPTLALEETYKPSEEGEQFEAGKIATGEPMAFFARIKNSMPKIGKGDGAFRILINTDVSWWASPTWQCAALMAVAQLLQRSAPVEVWVQQGWLCGSSENDGVTLFQVFAGQQLSARNLYFWIGSPYKDNPYSYVVNRQLGRVGSGVSHEPELPCDLYIYGQYMPPVGDMEKWAEWVAKTSRPILFDEELPSGWTGFEVKRPKRN